MPSVKIILGPNDIFLGAEPDEGIDIVLVRKRRDIKPIDLDDHKDAINRLRTLYQTCVDHMDVWTIPYAQREREHDKFRRALRQLIRDIGEEMGISGHNVRYDVNRRIFTKHYEGLGKIHLYSKGWGNHISVDAKGYMRTICTDDIAYAEPAVDVLAKVWMELAELIPKPINKIKGDKDAPTRRRYRH